MTLISTDLLDHSLVQNLSQLDFFIRVIVATGIGFVIGLEREHASISEKSKVMAGVRTFSFIALLGLLMTFLSLLLSPLIFIVGFMSVLVMVGLSYWITAKNGDIGGTTELAILLTYVLGATTLIGYIELSLALTVVIVVLLSIKLQLQNVIGQITYDELYAFIQFVVLALLIFPFLPDKFFGPYNVFNPREVGWIILLTSGFGFFGYLLIKFMGPDRGIVLSGILGGLVSSTLVTWVFSKKSKETPQLSDHCAVAILLASCIMVIRVFIWIFIFKKALLVRMAPPLFLILIAGLSVVYWLYYHQKSKEVIDTEIPKGRPLNLSEALFFGILYTAILFIVSYAHDKFGTQGTYISSFIASLTDIDAITISMSKLAGVAIEFITAENAILIATISNTLVKIGIALSVGSTELKKHVVLGYAIIFLAAIAGFIWININ